MDPNSPVTDLDSLLAAIPSSSAAIVSALHNLAIAHGCGYRAEEGETGGSHKVVYSGMGLEMCVDGEAVVLCTDYDVRAFLEFYRNRADEATKVLLFEAAIPCCFCMDDKCTTVLTDRRICLGDRAKQLCGPYRHRLELPVTGANVGLMGPVLDMAFRYCTADMHDDVTRHNDVAYEVRTEPEAYVVGYRHRSTMVSVRTEEFIAACFARAEDGTSRLGALARALALPGAIGYAAVTTDFVDGLDYVFTLGVPCPPDRLPADLPDGVTAVRIPAGEYAVYNSSAHDYGSIWRHFRDHFFEAERKGFDPSRPYFERFDADGRLYDVSIPVAAGLPANSGLRRRILRTPDLRLAGYSVWQETDFPLYRDVSNPLGRVQRAFPRADRYVHGSVHSRPGQPICERYGAELGRSDPVPPGMEELTVAGGHWHVASYPYPAPPEYLLEMPEGAPGGLDPVNHPRDFIEMVYNGRGAYSETWVPVRVTGERIVEVVERPDGRLIGKQVSLPQTPISGTDIAAFRDLPANPVKGSDTLAFRFEQHGGKYYHGAPIIQGVEVGADVETPEGMDSFALAGGKYVRLSESGPNGEMDWREPGYALSNLARDTGYEPDLSRSFYVLQSGYGREFALYVPIR